MAGPDTKNKILIVSQEWGGEEGFGCVRDRLADTEMFHKILLANICFILS